MENPCPPIFTLPPACLAVFQPASKFPVAHLLTDWKAFKLKRGTTGMPRLPPDEHPPPPRPPAAVQAMWAPHSATDMQISGQGDRFYFFFKCLVGMLKGGRDKLCVLHHSTLSGRMTHFYLMTLFIKCLLPIKIEKWGQGRKKRQKLIYFLRLSWKFGLKFLGSFIIIVGKIGLANISSWGFPFRLFTSIFVGIGLVYITRITMQNSQRFFFSLFSSSGLRSGPSIT